MEIRSSMLTAPDQPLASSFCPFSGPTKGGHKRSNARLGMFHSHLAARAAYMRREPQGSPRSLGLVWVDCPRSVVSAGLVRAWRSRPRFTRD